MIANRQVFKKRTTHNPYAFGLQLLKKRKEQQDAKLVDASVASTKGSLSLAFNDDDFPSPYAHSTGSNRDSSSNHLHHHNRHYHHHDHHAAMSDDDCNDGATNDDDTATSASSAGCYLGSGTSTPSPSFHLLPHQADEQQHLPPSYSSFHWSNETQHDLHHPQPLQFPPPLLTTMMAGSGAAAFMVPPAAPPPPAEALLGCNVGFPAGLPARNKAVVCRRFLAGGDCSRTGGQCARGEHAPADAGCTLGGICPFRHVGAHHAEPTPRSVCKFLLHTGACLRDNCPFFHGTIDQLQALHSQGARAFRPADAYVVRDAEGEMMMVAAAAEAPAEQQQKKSSKTCRSSIF